MTSTPTPEPPDPHQPAPPRRPGPTFGDWAQVAGAAVFLLIGVLILPENRSVGIVTIAFSASCLITFVWIVAGKLAARRFDAETVNVAGGVPIRASRAVPLVMGLWMLGLGTVLVVFSAPYGPVMAGLGSLVMLGGLFPLVMLVRGSYDRGLQFDPEGLTFIEPGFRCLVSWDAIAAVGETDYASNPLLLLELDPAGATAVEPGTARDQAIAWMGRNISYYGAPIAVMTTQYRIALPVLATAIRTYVNDPEARNGLRPAPLTPAVQPAPTGPRPPAEPRRIEDQRNP